MTRDNELRHAQVSDGNNLLFDILIILVAIMVILGFIWDERWLELATISLIPVYSLEYIVPLDLLKCGSKAWVCNEYCLK